MVYRRLSASRAEPVGLIFRLAAFGNKFGKTIAIGILLYEGDSWADNGYLPQDGEGMLEVKLP